MSLTMGSSETKSNNLYKENLINKCDKTIYKISNNVFSYGKIDYDESYIISICELLDLGAKFVPSIYNNKFDYYSHIYSDMDEL